MKPEWKKTKTIYWKDELNDDFNRLDGIKESPDLKKNYHYIHKNPFRIIWDGFLYYVIAKPILGGYCLFHGIRWKNKKNLKRLRGRGAFLYANHVAISDVFKFQSFIIHLTKVNIVGLSDASSIPVARTIVKSFGYLPIPHPNDNANMLGLKKAVEHLVKKRREYILIYPEAHIWPYYTKIRDFKNVSFYYPAQCLAPVVPVVTTWRHVWYSKKPRQTVIFGRPIYPDKNATINENRDYLAEECKKQMIHLASSVKQVEYIKYIKVEDEAR